MGLLHPDLPGLAMTVQEQFQLKKVVKQKKA
jgi:hypothetical protein